MTGVGIELAAAGHDLDGMTAIVTGAGRGIGRACALFLGACGAAVVVNDLGTHVDGSGSDITVAAEVVAEIRAAGGQAVAHSGSASTPEGAAEMVELARVHFGEPDILINNAGILRNTKITEMTERDWDEVTSASLKSAYCCTHAVTPGMVARGRGQIVNMSSINAFSRGVTTRNPARHGRAHYAAAKAGVLGLTWAVAGELEDTGITCNAIMPTATTRLAVEMMRLRARSGEQTLDPDERDPADVAHLAAALASPRNRISGQVFLIDRGHIEWFAVPTSAKTLERDRPWTVDELLGALPRLVGAEPDRATAGG